MYLIILLFSQISHLPRILIQIQMLNKLGVLHTASCRHFVIIYAF